MSAGAGQLNLFGLTRELIDIPSISGEEADVGSFLARLLEGLGYHVELQEVTARNANVIATTGVPPRVVLSSHMDTVPPHISSREDDQFIHGRGACDAKGIIAAQIAAAEMLRAERVEEIGLLFTVDEESTSTGAKAANEHPLASSCRFLINGEPTDNRLATGSKGSMQLRVKTTGRAAHSAYPESGESAIEKLLDVLADIRRLSWPRDECFGETTCNIGIISGGMRANVIAPAAHAVLQIRLAVEAEPVKKMISEAAAGRASLEFYSVHDPQRMLSAGDLEQTLVRFTTDIPYLTNWGKPLLIGPGSILVAHTDREHVAKSELFRAVEIYRSLVHRVLGQPIRP